MMKDDRDDGDSEDDEAPYEEEEDWDRVQSLVSTVCRYTSI